MTTISSCIIFDTAHIIPNPSMLRPKLFCWHFQMNDQCKYDALNLQHVHASICHVDATKTYFMGIILLPLRDQRKDEQRISWLIAYSRENILQGQTKLQMVDNFPSHFAIPSVFQLLSLSFVPWRFIRNFYFHERYKFNFIFRRQCRIKIELCSYISILE